MADSIQDVDNSVKVQADGAVDKIKFTSNSSLVAELDSNSGLDLKENNIINVGDIALDSLTADASTIALKSNLVPDADVTIDGRDISADLDQAIKTSDSPTFVGLTLTGDLKVDGGDIGLTADTDLIQIAADSVTINGELSVDGDVTRKFNQGASDRDLIMYWPMEETDQHPKDYSGLNNHESDTGYTSATFTPNGKIGGCYDFEGYRVNLKIPWNASHDILQHMTLMAWVNLTTFDDSSTIIHKDWNYALMLTTTGKIRFITATPWANNLDGDTAFATDEWHHVAAVYDKEYMRVYLDGEPDGTKPETDNITIAAGKDIHLGAIIGRYNQCQGLIDEPKIWKRALSADEIKSEYLKRVHTKPFGDDEYVNGDLKVDGNIDGNLAANTVDTASIEDSAVTTAKIADANVTTAKLANDAVDETKLDETKNYTINSLITTGGIAAGNNEAIKWDVVEFSVDPPSPDTVGYTIDESKVIGMLCAGHPGPELVLSLTCDDNIFSTRAQINLDNLTIFYGGPLINPYVGDDTIHVIIFYVD
ncbi:hypothetical protein ES702_05985 [subsurface metagenome]